VRGLLSFEVDFWFVTTKRFAPNRTIRILTCRSQRQTLYVKKRGVLFLFFDWGGFRQFKETPLNCNFNHLSLVIGMVTVPKFNKSARIEIFLANAAGSRDLASVQRQNGFSSRSFLSFFFMRNICVSALSLLAGTPKPPADARSTKWSLCWPTSGPRNTPGTMPLVVRPARVAMWASKGPSFF